MALKERRPSAIVAKWLRIPGDTAGAVEMNVTGTSSSIIWFEYTCPTGKTFHLETFNMIMLDKGITPDKFGALSALANGILFDITDANSTTLLDFLDGIPIKDNAEWNAISGVESVLTDATNEDEFAIHVHFSDLLGADIQLNAGERIRIGVQDDLSGLTEFRAMVFGVSDDAV